VTGGGERKGAIVAIIVAILAVMLLVGVLKVAFKIVLIGVVALGAVAAFYALRDRIGGPRA
jgi:hypothetical protein